MVSRQQRGLPLYTIILTVIMVMVWYQAFYRSNPQLEALLDAYKHVVHQEKLLHDALKERMKKNMIYMQKKIESIEEMQYSIDAQVQQLRDLIVEMKEKNP